MRWTAFVFCTAIAVSSFTLLYSDKLNNKLKNIAKPPAGIANAPNAELVKLKSIGTTIETFAKKNKYNSEYCFLIDMKLSSGSNRFFVYDLKKDSILAQGLVAHGSGSDNGGKELVFSNTISSNSTSLGKYKIGNSYNGKFGLAYKLHGLDKTNDNAFNRFVVLHSHSCVPQNEVAPLEICRSWGCPTVSPYFLTTLKMYLDKPGKPVLLQVFY